MAGLPFDGAGRSGHTPAGNRGVATRCGGESVTIMEQWISAALQAVDPYMVLLFCLTADPVVNFFIGSFLLALGCVVVGEVTSVAGHPLEPAAPSKISSRRSGARNRPASRPTRWATMPATRPSTRPPTMPGGDIFLPWPPTRPACSGPFPLPWAGCRSILPGSTSCWRSPCPCSSARPWDTCSASSPSTSCAGSSSNTSTPGFHTLKESTRCSMTTADKQRPLSTAGHGYKAAPWIRGHKTTRSRPPSERETPILPSEHPQRDLPGADRHPTGCWR